MVRQRHQSGAAQRETHVSSPIDYASPSDRLYGSQMDLEAVTVVDLGQGSVTDGAIAEGGLDGGTLVRAGTLPPSTFDPTPPLAPLLISVVPDLQPQPDGSQLVVLVVTIEAPINPDTGENEWADDYFGTYIYTTNENDLDPLTPKPVWTHPITTLIGKGFDVGYVVGLPGNTEHWVQVQSVNTMGVRSVLVPTGGYKVTTLADNSAPGVPQGVTGVGGYKGMGIHWGASSESDLMVYEVRYAPALADMSGPDTTAWTVVRTRGNTIGIQNILPADYYAQVRAIDFSKNVATSVDDPTAVNSLQFPDAGWSALVGPMTASLIGSADAYFGEVIANIIETDAIDASTIETGVLSVSTEDGPNADGIEVLYQKRVVGKWDEKGLVVRSKTVGRNEQDYIELVGGDGTALSGPELNIYKGGAKVSAVTKDGIDATSILFGVAEGGHNLVFNSSFELSKFVATTKLTVGSGGSTLAGGVGGWVMVSNTNATLGAAAVTIATL